eukprot:229700-Amorphochlora_amoeboformis.AAC.1
MYRPFEQFVNHIGCDDDQVINFYASLYAYVHVHLRVAVAGRESRKSRREMSFRELPTISPCASSLPLIPTAKTLVLPYFPKKEEGETHAQILLICQLAHFKTTRRLWESVIWLVSAKIERDASQHDIVLLLGTCIRLLATRGIYDTIPKHDTGVSTIFRALNHDSFL